MKTYHISKHFVSDLFAPLVGASQKLRQAMTHAPGGDVITSTRLDQTNSKGLPARAGGQTEDRNGQPKVLFIEGCDFETFPAGGQLAMARSFLKLFGKQLALVGMTRDASDVGKWTKKSINGGSYWFFSVGTRKISSRKPLVPARLTLYLSLQRYRRKILSLGCRHAMTRAPEALLAVSGWGLDNLCYMFPGVANPLQISRYGFARKIWPLFDLLLFSALDRVGLILACADEEAIQGMVSRSRGRISRERIVQFATCVDLSEFRPASVQEARASLGIPFQSTVFVTSGRIGRFKGWQFLLDAFAEFRSRCPEALLIFVGDGEEGTLLAASVAERNLGSHVRITGFQRPSEVACYLNAADVVVSASLVEGWSVAMLEALACGKPIVTTHVSGASEMIIVERNGFILHTRNPEEYAKAMESALGLKNVQAVSTAIAARFDMTRFGERLSSLWPHLHMEGHRANTGNPT